ncbi:MAG: DUF4446 family protein [Clostridia bacterium]|nr:DUF4446 family protein [Clostridia bacterium]
METILQSKEFLILIIVIFTMLFINFALLIYSIVTTRRLKKKYDEFMTRLGNGENITDMLRKYIQDVLNVSEENQSLKKYCKELEKNMNKCIQKVGMVRYNAYQHTGSDLCFALALLDFEDNGVILNGIYSRDNTTNTYAKPVEHGVSKYTLVKEEEEALNIAKQSGYKYFMSVN